MLIATMDSHTRETLEGRQRGGGKGSGEVGSLVPTFVLSLVFPLPDNLKEKIKTMIFLYQASFTKQF